MASRFSAGLIATATGFVVSLATAAFLISLRAGFGQADLSVFRTWTLVSLPGLFLLGAFLSGWLADRRPSIAVSLAAVIGSVYGYLYTLLNLALLGPWFQAWSFNVLYCWALASGLGLLGATLFRRAQRSSTADGRA